MPLFAQIPHPARLLVAPRRALRQPRPDSQSEFKTTRPCIQMMDDFVRNFLCRTGMQRSLEIFETEWYEVWVARCSQPSRTPTEMRRIFPSR